MIRRLLERLHLRRRRTYREEILRDDPWAYWPLDEPTPTTPPAEPRS